MKKLILSLLFFVGFLTLGFSQNIKSVSDSVTLWNGKKVSKAEVDLIFKKAWDESFGKMTSEDKKLFEGVNIQLTIPKEEEVIEPDSMDVKSL
jgi:hypothetical protein